MCREALQNSNGFILKKKDQSLLYRMLHLPSIWSRKRCFIKSKSEWMLLHGCMMLLYNLLATFSWSGMRAFAPQPRVGCCGGRLLDQRGSKYARETKKEEKASGRQSVAKLFIEKNAVKKNLLASSCSRLERRHRNYCIAKLWFVGHVVYQRRGRYIGVALITACYSYWGTVTDRAAPRLREIGDEHLVSHRCGSPRYFRHIQSSEALFLFLPLLLIGELLIWIEVDSWLAKAETERITLLSMSRTLRKYPAPQQQLVPYRIVAQLISYGNVIRQCHTKTIKTHNCKIVRALNCTSRGVIGGLKRVVLVERQVAHNHQKWAAPFNVWLGNDTVRTSTKEMTHLWKFWAFIPAGRPSVLKQSTRMTIDAVQDGWPKRFRQLNCTGVRTKKSNSLATAAGTGDQCAHLQDEGADVKSDRLLFPPCMVNGLRSLTLQHHAVF